MGRCSWKDYALLNIQHSAVLEAQEADGFISICWHNWLALNTPPPTPPPPPPPTPPHHHHHYNITYFKLSKMACVILWYSRLLRGRSNEHAPCCVWACGWTWNAWASTSVSQDKPFGHPDSHPLTSSDQNCKCQQLLRISLGLGILGLVMGWCTIYRCVAALPSSKGLCTIWSSLCPCAVIDQILLTQWVTHVVFLHK